MNRFLALLAVGLFVFPCVAQQATAVRGWVEDGVAHTPGNSAETIKQAIANGAPYVFVDDTSKTVWRIDNPQAVKGHEGQHIAFSGTMVPNVNTIHIEHLRVLKNQKPGASADAIGR